MKFLSFQIAGCFYIILLSIIYFSKKRVNNIDNKIFATLIITNIFGVALDILSTALAAFDFNNIFLNLVSKLYLIYLISWLLLFTLYILSISKEDAFLKILKKSLPTILVIYFLMFICIFLLPLFNYATPEKIYTYGPAATLTYLFAGTCSVIWIVSIIINRKNLKNKKYIPLFIFAITGLIAGIIQHAAPEVLIITFVLIFINFLMYFTIENPDVKIIEQLNVAKDQADRANRAKTDFLSSMSHEIRTPLNAIVGFSQALAEEDLNEQAKGEVKDIIMASDTLLEIVNGILDISKIEANKLEIVSVEYDFHSILDELVSLAKARLGEKPLDFKVNFAPDLPKYVYGDKVRVKQVILNLLTNAIKYTRSGWIEFNVNCIKKNDISRIIISVEDSGIGIKPESINKLFNKFERLDIEKNNTIEGTGLGLAITKKLVDLMGGKIVVQSVYGQGSKFTIALDQKIVENPTNPALCEKKVDDIKNLDLSNKRVLVVDDNRINLKVATRLLSDYKCIIETLESGFNCIEKHEVGAHYDLILMDDMMPKMSGVETLNKLKAMEDFKTPVVALTANAISGMREKYLAEGFDDYLAKPIEKDELKRVLNKFLG